MAKLNDIAKMLAEAERRRLYRKIDYFKPYPKQTAFFDMGLTHRERLLRAGNQLGKTEAGAVEAVYHMTGHYPPDWLGRTWDRPTRGWLAGESALLVRDVQQTKLCGAPGVESALGTGYIPKEAFADKPTLGRGVTDGFDTIQVKHKSGGVSTATFKSYEQGRAKFQGEPVDWIWCDEEPAEEIYLECLTRTNATGGMIYTTFTPLKGLTKLIEKFWAGTPGCGEVVMTMADAIACGMYTQKRADEIAMTYPDWQRDARLNGVPILGEGAVFEGVLLEDILVPIRVVGEDIVHDEIGPLQSLHWYKLWAIDFGFGHPFAAVLLAHDRDSDVIYVLGGFSMKGSIPALHAPRMLAMAANVPVAWPHDGHQHDKGSGEVLAKQYSATGLNMMMSHATFKEGGFSTEAGVLDILTRMRTDRFKVSKYFFEWHNEFRKYHRKDGLIVKKDDDIMSATRVGVMQIRSAKQIPIGSRREKKHLGVVIADGVDTDLWGS